MPWDRRGEARNAQAMKPMVAHCIGATALRPVAASMTILGRPRVPSQGGTPLAR